MIVLILPALLFGADPKRVEVTDISPRMNGQTIIVEGIVVASGAARGGDGATINLRR